MCLTGNKNSGRGKGMLGFWLIESEGYPTLMYKDWYILRIKDGEIERFGSISNEPELNLDKDGCVRVSENTT